MIAGTSTGLNFPGSIAVDSSGNVYAANTNAKPVTITAYSAAGVTRGGDIAPEATIGGPHSGLDSTTQIALDSRRRIYATTQSPDSVRIFPADSNGDVAAVAVIAGGHTKLDSPDAVAIGSRGNIYVENAGSGSNPHGSITIYRAGSVGDVAPIAIIRGEKTGLPASSGIAVDPRGRIYVAGVDCPNPDIFVFSANCVNVFAPNAKGNVAPITTIAIENNRTEAFTAIAIAP
jgi:hypothetical protein